MPDELKPSTPTFFQKYGTILIVLGVVAVLGCLGLFTLLGLGVSVFNRTLQDARHEVALSQCDALEAALKVSQKRGDIGTDPTTVLSELESQGILRGDDSTTDPWGETFVVTLVDGVFRVHSKGPDRKDGTDDDVKTEG